MTSLRATAAIPPEATPARPLPLSSPGGRGNFPAAHPTQRDAARSIRVAFHTADDAGRCEALPPRAVGSAVGAMRATRPFGGHSSAKAGNGTLSQLDKARIRAAVAALVPTIRANLLG